MIPNAGMDWLQAQSNTRNAVQHQHDAPASGSDTGDPTTLVRRSLETLSARRGTTCLPSRACPDMMRHLLRSIFNESAEGSLRPTALAVAAASRSIAQQPSPTSRVSLQAANNSARFDQTVEN